MKQPIKVKGHSLIDYAFAADNVTLPLALGQRGSARTIPLAFAGIQGGLTALTDQPYAAKGLVPFKAHGKSEKYALPLLTGSLIATGALDQPRSRSYFGALLGALVTVYTLTDWDARPPRGRWTPWRR